MAAEPKSTSDIGNKFFASSCTTQFDNTVFQYTWTINDYKTYYNLSNGMMSSIFSDLTPDGLKWFMQLDRKYKQSRNMMSFYLVLLSSNLESFQAACEFSILDSKLEPVHERTIINTFSDTNNHVYVDLIEQNTLFSQSSIYLPNNSLTLLCKISILGDIKYILSKHPRRFQKNLLPKLFKDSQFYDLTVSVRGRKLHAHKAILAAASPKFRAMFEHDMREIKKKNLVKIFDLDYEVVEEMLRFIYTSKISNLDKIAHNLFVAADKYALDELQFKCQEAMIKNLSIENAAQYYVVADQHNAEELKIRVGVFIETNSSKVIGTSGFHDAFQANHELFNGLNFVE